MCAAAGHPQNKAVRFAGRPENRSIIIIKKHRFPSFVYDNTDTKKIFTVLKKTLRDVCKELDHTNLNDKAEFLQNPSAERIALYVYRRITESLPELKKNTTSTKEAYLYAIDVFETDTSRARYIAE